VDQEELYGCAGHGLGLSNYYWGLQIGPLEEPVAVDGVAAGSDLPLAVPIPTVPPGAPRKVAVCSRYGLSEPVTDMAGGVVPPRPLRVKENRTGFSYRERSAYPEPVSRQTHRLFP